MTAIPPYRRRAETWFPAASAVAALAVYFFVCDAAALAQTGQTAPKERSAVDAVKQKDQELEALRAEQKKSADAARKLEDEIDAIGADRRKLNQSLIDAATRIRAIEDRIAATEARMKPLADKEAALRASLDTRRAAISEVLAALQRMGRRPPPAVMVKPEDALESVRTAMMLGAILPEMRQQAEALASDLAGLVRVRQDIAAERDKLNADLAAQSNERQRMAALIGERQKRQGEVEKSLAGERERAGQLARQAENLKDLIAKLEQGLDSATRASRNAAQGGEAGRRDLAALKDPGRLGPAVAFASAKGLLPLPVNGVKIRDFGATDEFGGTEKGVSIATRSAAQVTAPCDGWVVYCSAVSFVRPTLDPECRRRISCAVGGHGADFGRGGPIRSHRRTGGGDGKRTPGGVRDCGWFWPAGALYRVPKRRVPGRSGPVVGDQR